MDKHFAQKVIGSLPAERCSEGFIEVLFLHDMFEQFISLALFQYAGEILFVLVIIIQLDYIRVVQP